MADGYPIPFREIDFQLLNDDSDQSALTLDGIVLGSCNEWDSKPGLSCPIQTKIHSTIEIAAQILEDYRDGKLSYNT